MLWHYWAQNSILSRVAVTIPIPISNRLLYIHVFVLYLHIFYLFMTWIILFIKTICVFVDLTFAFELWFDLIVWHFYLYIVFQDKTGPNYNCNSLIDRNCTMISATWDPTESAFESLNTETPKDVRQYMTVAVDLVIRGIQEPVRFQIETPVRIYGQAERFWYFQKRSLIQQFFLNLKEVRVKAAVVSKYSIIIIEYKTMPINDE